MTEEGELTRYLHKLKYQKGNSSSSSTYSSSSSSEEEQLGEEWWDKNWARRYRSPYITDELVEKLAPYVKRLEATPAYQEYARYIQNFGVPEKPLTFEEKLQMAKVWHEREDPQAFWKKYHEEQKKEEGRKSQFNEKLQWLEAEKKRKQP